MCIRDENNEFMCAKTILVNANKTPQEAKAVCLPDVLNQLHEMDVYRVTIELECKQVADEIYGDYTYAIDFRSIRNPLTFKSKL